MSDLISLGIESTADNLGIGVVTSEHEVLANYIKVHVPPEGGIHPREAARHHSQNMGKAIKTALEQANVNLTTELIDMIIAQRNFQANSRALEVNNQLNQTVLNIR